MKSPSPLDKLTDAQIERLLRDIYADIDDETAESDELNTRENFYRELVFGGQVTPKVRQ